MDSVANSFLDRVDRGTVGLAAELRRDLNHRALLYAQREGLLHALSDGSSPSVIFGQDDRGVHGNFHPASYRAICSNRSWSRRLRKVHTSSRRMLVRADWQWMELDCASSSDALLMNIFCHPRALSCGNLAALLGVQATATPTFGYRPRIPLLNSLVDQTEVDMKLDGVMVEAKLTESNMQVSSLQKLLRYRDLDEVFDVCRLQKGHLGIRGYQAIRGILAAFVTGSDFCLLCDGRRSDMIEEWFCVLQAVRMADLRCRVKLLSWQELSATLPKTLQAFLSNKYGIAP